jgi:hypothetical protein
MGNSRKASFVDMVLLSHLYLVSLFRMTVLADRSRGRPERTWSERRLGMDCEVLKHSACQSIYRCCSVCVPASKLV